MLFKKRIKVSIFFIPPKKKKKKSFFFDFFPCVKKLYISLWRFWCNRLHIRRRLVKGNTVRCRNCARSCKHFNRQWKLSVDNLRNTNS